jgi:hypothetical protein
MPPPLPSLSTRAVLLLILIAGLSISTRAQAQRSQFDILKGDRVVGRIMTLKQEEAGRTDYLMTSYSVFEVMMKQVVTTSMAAEYKEGLLRSCHSLVKVNGNMRDSSHLAPRAGKLMGYVHPGPAAQKEHPVKWTTARMYYEEPVGQASIFVESALAFCTLVRTGAGTYTLTLPNKSENHYVYRKGVLQEVRVDRVFFDLVFRRV